MKVYIVFFDCPPSRNYVLHVFSTFSAASAHALASATKLKDQNPGSTMHAHDSGYQVVLKHPTWLQQTFFLLAECEVSQ